MKILIIMGGFFPGKKYGGPPVSIDNFCSLMNNHDCNIVTRDHDLFETERFTGIQEGWNDRGNCKVRYMSDSEYNKASFERIMMELKPDILYLQGLFQSCIRPCLQLAKKHNIPVLLAPRGELCEGALNIKKWKKTPYIEAVKLMGLVKSIHWQSTSDEETEAIKRIMKTEDNHIHLLDNIPSIPNIDYPREQKVTGRGKFVYLSRIHPKKNLLFAISLFREAQGNVEFDIYGSIEDEEYWNQCQDEIECLPDNVKVEYKGLVNHDQVHKVFCQYDAFLFPTLSENYGHVIAESLIVGTPVIISDQTPWRGLEVTGAGWDIPLTKPESFKTAIAEIVSMDSKQFGEKNNDVLEYINIRLDIEKLKKEYTKAITESTQ